MPKDDGSTVVYQFRPQSEGGPHVADVKDAKHIARFKEITESYRPGPKAKWPDVLPESGIVVASDKPTPPPARFGEGDVVKKPKEVIVADDVAV
jgi:hypothetical protein